MHRKLMTAAVVALLAAMSVPQAQAGEASFGADVVSAYVFRGATINDEVNVQPYLEGAFGPVTAGTWGNYNTDSSNLDEIDYYASVALPMGDEAPVGVDLGYTLYTYPETASLNDAGEAENADADGEINVGISIDAPLSPSVGVNYGIDGAIDEQLYVELGLGLDHAYNDTYSSSAGLTVGFLGQEADGSAQDTGLAFVGLSAGVGAGPVSVSVNYYIETDDNVLVIDEDVVGVLSIDLGGAIAMLGSE